MIESLLVFSRIAKNPQPFELVSLKIVIQRGIDTLQVPIDETKGTIHIGEIVDLNGEPSLLLKLFQNLIANALKFHKKDEPPVINIRSQVNENQFCEIIVEDNGIGFDEKFADKIFIPLKRLVSNDEYEGSGIGLSTCKKIVDFHKGTITVHSQPDKGIKFIISLPMK
jgi:light-regulated signal transduction histidine kinase (bacteriophytochrome)